MRTAHIVFALPLIVQISCGDPSLGPTGPQGEPGPKGEPGPVGTLPAQLVGVLPNSVYAERPVTLQVSGLLTHFSAGTTVRFDDPAISVSKISVQGPGYLVATVQAGREVRLGAHDITVESAAVDPSGQPTPGRETVSLKGALVVAGTLGAEATGNSKTVEQGGVVDWNIRNLDRDNPLGSVVRIDGGVRGLVVSSLSGRMVGYGLVDALTPPGPISLHATSEVAGQKLGYALEPSGPSVPQVTARTATPLGLGVTRTGEKLFAGKQSNLYKLTLGGDAQLVSLTFAVEGGLLSSPLLGATAPASGRFADGQLFYVSTNLLTQTALAYVPSRGDAYAAVLTTQLSGGGTYSVTARAATAIEVSLLEPGTKDSPTSPLLDLVLDGPRLGQRGAIDGVVDVDYLRIRPAKTGRLYVQAVTPGQGLSPSTVSVAILAGDCVTPLAALRPVAQEAAVTAGQSYCAVVSSPTGYVGPYQLIATQEL